MKLKLHHSHDALAWLPALIVFVLIIIFAVTCAMVLVKTANRVLNPPPYTGPGTNTPPESTFTGVTPYDAIPNITPEDIATLAALSANPTREFEVVILRSTNLIHWEFLTRTNTVNHQVVWDDPNPPYPNGFYKPLVVVP